MTFWNFANAPKTEIFLYKRCKQHFFHMHSKTPCSVHVLVIVQFSSVTGLFCIAITVGRKNITKKLNDSEYRRNTLNAFVTKVAKLKCR